MDDEIDEILTEEPEETTEEATEVATEEPVEKPKEPEGPERDEQGRFKGKGEEESAPPAPEEKTEFDGAATLAERRKRQQVEEQLADLQRQLQELRNPPQPAAPPPDMFEDPQAWESYQRNQTLEQANQLSRINASEMAARSQFPDFQERYDQFNRMAQANPAIVQTALADPHPWKKAYEIASNAATMEQLGAVDIEDLKAKIRAEIEAENPNKAPPTLSNQRSAAPRNTFVDEVPEDLEDLLR